MKNRSAAKHVLYNAGLQLSISIAHVAAAAWTVAISFGLAGDGLSLGGAAGLFFKAFAIAGVLWTPVNAMGLYKRRPWARISTIAYYVVAMPFCCCLPLGVYGLWSLTRPEVKSLLDGE
jgi:hypothetical protein